MSISSAVDRGVLAFERAVLGAGVLGIALSNIVNVTARNLTGGSLSFIEELNQAFMIWITFAGLGLGARQARHIRMSALSDQLRGPSRKVLAVVTAAGTSLVLAVLAAYAIEYVATSQAVGRVTPALRIPSWLIQAVVPVGLGLGAFEYALDAWRILRGDARPEVGDPHRDTGVAEERVAIRDESGRGAGGPP